MNNSAFAGDDFAVVAESEEKAKEINNYRVEHSQIKTNTINFS